MKSVGRAVVRQGVADRGVELVDVERRGGIVVLALVAGAALDCVGMSEQALTGGIRDGGWPALGDGVAENIVVSAARCFILLAGRGAIVRSNLFFSCLR